MTTQEYLTIAEGAEYLGLTEKACRKWIERGKLPYRRLGRRVLIGKSDLDRFLASLPGMTVEDAVTRVEIG